MQSDPGTRRAFSLEWPTWTLDTAWGTGTGSQTLLAAVGQLHPSAE